MYKFFCNECDFNAVDIWENNHKYRFCPKCGHVNTQASPVKPSCGYTKCTPIDYCICNTQALEPDEYCPIHGGAIKKPSCMYCGRFIKIENRT